jgi:hypothetical protein
VKLIRTLLLALLPLGAAQAATVLDPVVKITAEERYDDDLLLRTGPATGGQLMTKLSPQVGLEVKNRNLVSRSWYSPDLLIRHGSGRWSVDHRGHLDVEKELSERSVLEGDLSVWRVSDPTSLPRLGMARTLSPVLYGKALLAGKTLVTEHWSVRPGYRFEGVRVFEGAAPPGFVHSPFVETWVALTPRTSVGADYRVQLFYFGAEVASGHGPSAAYRYRLSRLTTFTARAGASLFRRWGVDPASGVVPRVALELGREGEAVDVGFAAGHDLVGASGFTSTLWAQYASMMGAVRFNAPLRGFAAVSYFRNGRAPEVGFTLVPTTGPGSAQGYAVGGGLEWRIIRRASLIGAFDRFAQVGVEDPAMVARNIVSVRLSVTAF